jgi:histidinol-phosphatase (PHP family)
MCIELNSAGLRKPVKECYPSNAILKKCYESDIPVTFGSDSHKPEEVGWEIERALSILREVGYSQVVGFQNRKKIFYDI